MRRIIRLSNMILLPSYLTGFSSKSDGSAGIRFSTQELNASDFALLKDHLNEFGILAFRPNATSIELPKDEPDEDFEKSPSERLRNTMFVYFSDVLHGDKANFNAFYREQIESIITKYKNKLD